MARVQLSCADGVDRAVGVGLQLITFVRPGDYCEWCYQHMHGLPIVWRELGARVQPLLVAYVSTARRGDALREYREVAGAPMCFDETGVLWRTHHLVRTPFTMLLDDGQIKYGSDRPLTDTTSQVSFLAAVRQHYR